MHLNRYDPRSDREILLSIERLLKKLIGEEEMADIFDRIIAGIAALQAGDTSALQAHVAAIDSHLSQVDGEVLGLQSDDTSGKARLDAIEAGLGKVADAVNPASSGGGSGSGAPSGGAPSGGAPAPAGGDAGSANPGGDGSAPAPTGDGSAGASGAIPTSGPGSETTGQVDQPDTQP